MQGKGACSVRSLIYIRVYSWKLCFKFSQILSSNVTHPFNERTVILPLNLITICTRNKTLLYVIDVVLT